MIIFATSYDEATRVTFAVAKIVGRSGDLEFLASDATRSKLQTNDNSGQGTALFMCHGNSRVLKGQDRNPAVDQYNVSMLTGCSVFAFACHSGKSLADSAMNSGATAWWGYIDTTHLSPEAEATPQLFKPLFDDVRTALVTARNRADVRRSLEIIKGTADQIRETLVKQHASQVREVSFEGFFALSTFWRRLCVVLPGGERVRHPDALDYLM